LVIAYALGILERALEPFPEALAAYKEARREHLAPSGLKSEPDVKAESMSLVG
jgi:hypothetical protein